MSWWTDLIGTLGNTFRIGKAKALFDASGLTAERTYTLPDSSGTISLGGGGGSVAINDLGDATGNGVINIGANQLSLQLNGVDSFVLDGSGLDPYGIIATTYVNIGVTSQGLTLIQSASVGIGGNVSLCPGGEYLSFYGGSGSPQCSPIADPDGGMVIDSDCRAAVIALFSYLRARGDLAT